MKHRIGERVGAIMGEGNGEVRLFGYGTYEGDHVPPPGVKLFGVELHSIGRKNPKIRLDSGKVVWGCECWWGPESAVKKAIGNKKVVEADIELERALAPKAVVESKGESYAQDQR